MLRTRRGWIALLLILSVAAALAYGYFYRVDRPNLDRRLQFHDGILNRTADSPYRYRVLVPFLVEGLTRLLSGFMAASRAFLLAFALYDLAAIALFLLLLFVYLRGWFSWEASLLGVLFVGCTAPVALADHFYQPWSLLEAALFAAAFTAIRKDRRLLLLLLVAFATLTKETAFFIPVVYLLANLDLSRSWGRTVRLDRKAALWTCGYVLVWLVVYGCTRVWAGSAPHTESLAGILARNLAPYRMFLAVIRWSVFLGLFWVLVVLGIRRAPAFVRRTALLIPLYLVSLAVWGQWNEVRLLMPLYPVLVPLGLSFIYRDRGGERPGLGECAGGS